MKAIVIIDGSLPVGVIANCAAALGASLGAARPDIIGPELVDASGTRHPGITGLPLPVLAAGSDALRAIFVAAGSDPAVTAVGFTDIARSCLSYADYESRLAKTRLDDIGFLGVLLVGAPKAIGRLTGSLPLLR